MPSRVAVIALVLLAFTIRVPAADSAVATPPRKLDLPARYLREFVRPATKEEAAAYILSLMTADERQLFLGTPEEGLIRFHFGLGTGIRNQFGLWGGNRALRDSLGVAHPDEMSAQIIKCVWEQIRASAGNDAVQKVDAIERSLKSIFLADDRYEWKSATSNLQYRTTTLGALVHDMNAAIESAFRAGAGTELARVQIEAVGAASVQITINNRAAQPRTTAPAEQSLANLLVQLGPPFGRYVVLYEYPYVRIFDAPVSNNSSAQPEPTSPTDDSSAESRSRRVPGVPHR